MKTKITVLVISIGVILTVSKCELRKTSNLIPEGYVKLEIPVFSSVDSCGCNDHIIKTLKNKSDTLKIINGIGRITTKSGIMVSTSIICNLPKELLDSSQNKKYPIIFSGEEHSPYKPIIGPPIFIYSEIIVIELFIKL